MKVSFRAMVLAVAMAAPAWMSASAGEGLTIRFIGGEAYDATSVSYAGSEVALNGGCAAPAGCAAAAPGCAAAAAPSCGTDAACGANACGCDNGCGDDCCDFDFGPFLPCKRWQIQAGAPIMVRNNYHLGYTVTPGQIVQVSSDAPSAGVFAGFQGNAIKYRDNCRDLEMGVMFLGNGGPLAVDFGSAPVGVSGGTALASVYKSDIFSAEGNLRFRHGDWFSLIAGVRYIGLNESLLFAGYGASEGAGLIETKNNLFGGQLGASAILAVHGRWTFNGVIRGGVYYNDATYRAIGIIDTTPFLGENDANPWAVEADAQLMATWWLTDHFGLRFGYQVMVFDRVALAPSQLGNYAVNTHATPFFHGALVQGELAW